MKKLPNKPSALIRLAVHDLELTMQDKEHYKIDMDDWHQPNGKCSVCFAGGVMAQSLKQSPFSSVVPSDFDMNTHIKLLAINEFREGYICNGLNLLGIRYIHMEDLPSRVPVKAFNKNKKKFISDMMALADLFQIFNL